MPIDTEIKSYLESLNANKPEFTALTIEQIRANKTGYFIPQPVTNDPDVEITNQKISVDNGSINLRFYQPRNQSKALPVMIYIHGGGFFAGSIDHYDPFCVATVKTANCIVISVDYRLAPENPFPGPPQDCYEAVHWIIEHAAELKINPSKIILAGDSAGANLVCAVTFMMRDHHEATLAGQILIFPFLDCNYDRPSYLAYPIIGFTREAMTWVWNHYLNNAADYQNPYAMPARQTNFSHLPPALVITAECDALHDEGFDYTEKLKAANSLFEYHNYPGMIHGFNFLENMSQAARAATQDLYQRLARFINQ